MVSYTQNNIPTLHKKAWQNMGVLPIATAVGMHVISDGSGMSNYAMYVTSATAQYLYQFDEDGYVQVTSGALAGTFAVGACGVYHPWSMSYTATGGSTKTITVSSSTHNFCGFIVGETVEFTSGANIGLRRKITKLINDGGIAAQTITLYFDEAVTAVANNDTFRATTGRFFVLNAYTALAAGVWKSFDIGTMAWSGNLATTNLPAAWATGGEAVLAYNRAVVKADSTATAGANTTLTDSTKSWDVNAYTKHIVRITGGTGLDQVRNIVSNTATELTVDVAWTSNPDTTSTYQIEGGDLFATGFATSGGNTTLVNSAKAWATNQWIGYQVRITSGTGIGQRRVITANDGTSLTVATWTTNPDNTSSYVIEGNEEKIYLLGNGAVAMYTYAVTGDAWALVSPVAARVGAPTTCIMAKWIGTTGVEGWADENNIMDGKYIYSPRGAAAATITRYNIPGNTWSTVVYAGAETFTTGSSCDSTGRYLYITQNANGRLFKYSVRGNQLEGVSKSDYAQGAAMNGSKLFIKKLDPDGKTTWVYMVHNTSTVVQRLMLY